MFSGYRQHPNKLFDVLFGSKVVKHRIAWRSFYNCKVEREDELRFTNLAGDGFFVYLTETSAERIRVALASCYGTDSDYFKLEQFRLQDPRQKCITGLRMKSLVENREEKQSSNGNPEIFPDMILTKVGVSSEGELADKSRKLTFQSTKRPDLGCPKNFLNHNDALSSYEEVKTPEALRRVFGTAKKMNLRSRIPFTNQEIVENEMNESVDGSSSEIDDDAFTGSDSL